MLNTGQRRGQWFTSHTHSQLGEEGTACHAGSHGGCSQDYSEPAKPGGRLCSNKRVWCPCAPWEGLIGLFG